MDEDALRQLADQLEVDTETLLDRWQGQPDNIIEDIFRIRDLDSGEIKDLELFDVQRRVAHAYFYGDAATLNAYKGRRIGYSFIFIACFLLEGILYPNSFYPLVSRSLSQAKNRIDDIQNLIDNAKVEIPTVKENTDYIELWNDSAFQAYSSDSDVSRGDRSARAVLMDEMAFMEDQERAYRAFGAFLVLGENRKMVEVSTPNTKNDLFMQEHERGSPNGDNGVLSIKQPTIANASEIDVNTSLYDQEVELVRPDLNIGRLETERLSDPEGFGQEYLCRPVVDEYRFFNEESLKEAQRRSTADDYATGINAPKDGGRRIMAIDVGIDHDDTVISITDHVGEKRKQRAVIVVDRDALIDAGVRFPDSGNANDIAELINHWYVRMDVDNVILDQGGVGKTFPSILHRKLGREVYNFDFSDREAVADMFGDTNVALRQGDVALLDNDRLYDEMQAIVKEKRKEHSKPYFSGKENSKSGKDDMAIATVMSLFPPKLSESPATKPAARERETSARLPSYKEDPDDFELAYGQGNVSRTERTRRDKYEARQTRRR